MFTVYILYSPNFDKTYVGYSSNLIARFHSHNSLGTKGWTMKFRPWVVVYCEYFDNKKDARIREKKLKSFQGRLWIKSNLESWFQYFN